MGTKTLWGRISPWAAWLWRWMPIPLRRVVIWHVMPQFLVGVCGVCLNPEGQALLLRHRFDKANGCEWGLPGGWMARGERPAEAMRREILEETGLPAEIGPVLLTDGDGEWVEIIYLCRVPKGPLTLQASELLDWQWVDPASEGVRLLPNHARALRLVAGERVP